MQCHGQAGPTGTLNWDMISYRFTGLRDKLGHDIIQVRKTGHAKRLTVEKISSIVNEISQLHYIIATCCMHATCMMQDEPIEPNKLLSYCYSLMTPHGPNKLLSYC